MTKEGNTDELHLLRCIERSDPSQELIRKIGRGDFIVDEERPQPENTKEG